jgi:hypothetical protein
MFIVTIFKVAIVKATIFEVTILEVTIKDTRMPIAWTDSHGWGRRPVTGDPPSVRFIVAIHPGIPGTRTCRPRDSHGHGSAELDSKRDSRRSH